MLYCTMAGVLGQQELLNTLTIGTLVHSGGTIDLTGTNTIHNMVSCGNGSLTLRQGEDGGVTTIHEYEKKHNCKVT